MLTELLERRAVLRGKFGNQVAAMHHAIGVVCQLNIKNTDELKFATKYQKFERHFQIYFFLFQFCF
jgi:hypothetical protein